MDEQQRAMNRRRFIAGLSAAGVGSALMPGALAAVAQDADEITVEMVDAAQHIAGLRFTSDELQVIAARLNRPDADASAYETLRAESLGNDTQPALVFNPIPPGMTLPTDRRPMRRQQVTLSMPATDADLAFLPVTHLARLVETRQVRPSELTELYLARLKQYDPALRCVVSVTEELARRQARQADEEIAAGTYRGPLHGIPWGRQGPAGRAGNEDDLGRVALQGPNDRHRRHRLQPVDRCRRHLDRQAVDGGTGVRGPLVRGGARGTPGTPSRGPAGRPPVRVRRRRPVWSVFRSGPRRAARSCRPRPETGSPGCAPPLGG